MKVDEEKRKRLETAVNFLISQGNIDGKTPIKSISAKMNRHRNNISAALNGDDKYFTRKFIIDFCATYGNLLSPDWILDGVGEMIQREYYHPKTKKLPSNLPTIKEVKGTKPRIPTMAMAGSLPDYIDGVMSYQCDYQPVIHQMPSYDFTMIVKGNSMEPKFEGGDEIACKRVYDVIEWGKTYVLDTSDGAVIKRIYDAGDKIRCVSYNKDEYPDFFVDKDNVRGFYKVVGLIRI